MTAKIEMYLFNSDFTAVDVINPEGEEVSFVVLHEDAEQLFEEFMQKIAKMEAGQELNNENEGEEDE